VQTAARPDRLGAGPQPQVIRVAEDDPRVEVCGLQLLEPHGLHRTERAHRHEHRRLDHAAPRPQKPRPRLPFLSQDLPPERASAHTSSDTFELNLKIFMRGFYFD
jgi:hypothetical protein